MFSSVSLNIVFLNYKNYRSPRWVSCPISWLLLRSLQHNKKIFLISKKFGRPFKKMKPKFFEFFFKNVVFSRVSVKNFKNLNTPSCRADKNTHFTKKQHVDNLIQKSLGVDLKTRKSHFLWKNFEKSGFLGNFPNFDRKFGISVKFYARVGNHNFLLACHLKNQNFRISILEF